MQTQAEKLLKKSWFCVGFGKTGKECKAKVNKYEPKRKVKIYFKIK